MQQGQSNLILIVQIGFLVNKNLKSLQKLYTNKTSLKTKPESEKK